MLETRQNLIDKLNNQREVESVDKVYVDKNESFIDVNNLQWNSVDIFLKSKQKLKTWQGSVICGRILKTIMEKNQENI